MTADVQIQILDPETVTRPEIAEALGHVVHGLKRMTVKDARYAEHHAFVNRLLELWQNAEP